MIIRAKRSFWALYAMAPRRPVMPHSVHPPAGSRWLDHSFECLPGSGTAGCFTECRFPAAGRCGLPGAGSRARPIPTRSRICGSSSPDARVIGLRRWPQTGCMSSCMCAGCRRCGGLSRRWRHGGYRCALGSSAPAWGTGCSSTRGPSTCAGPRFRRSLRRLG